MTPRRWGKQAACRCSRARTHARVACACLSVAGKTVSVATFVLALLVNVPGIKVAIFSTGKRASGNLLQLILDYLNRIPGCQDRILKSTQEELFLAPRGAGRVSARSGAARISNEGEGVSKLYRYAPCDAPPGRPSSRPLFVCVLCAQLPLDGRRSAHTHTHTNSLDARMLVNCVFMLRLMLKSPCLHAMHVCIRARGAAIARGLHDRACMPSPSPLVCVLCLCLACLSVSPPGTPRAPRPRRSWRRSRSPRPRRARTGCAPRGPGWPAAAAPRTAPPGRPAPPPAAGKHAR